MTKIYPSQDSNCNFLFFIFRFHGIHFAAAQLKFEVTMVHVLADFNNGEVRNRRKIQFHLLHTVLVVEDRNLEIEEIMTFLRRFALRNLAINDVTRQPWTRHTEMAN